MDEMWWLLAWGHLAATVNLESSVTEMLDPSMVICVLYALKVISICTMGVALIKTPTGYKHVMYTATEIKSCLKS